MVKAEAEGPGWKAEDVKPGVKKGEGTRGTEISNHRHNEENGRWKERSYGPEKCTNKKKNSVID